MKFCENIIKTQLNRILFIVIICLQWKWSKSQIYKSLGALGKQCDPNNENMIPCSVPRIRCPKETGICKCDPKYPIHVPEVGDCLDYRKLGEACLLYSQCQQIKYSACVGNVQPINLLTIAYFHKFKNKSNREYGRCRCKNGFKQKAEMCYPDTLDYFPCSQTVQCLYFNSWCEPLSLNDSQYIYDKNLCRFKRFGDRCKSNKECVNWDPNLECSHFTCFCKMGYVLDLVENRCKAVKKQNAKNKEFLWYIFVIGVVSLCFRIIFWCLQLLEALCHSKAKSDPAPCLFA